MDPQAILQAALVLGGVGLTFGVLVALAHSRLRVWEDPRIEGATERLPGSNCGACGFAGCRAFAEGLIGDETSPAGCTQLDEDGISALATFMGVEAGTAVKRVARLLCAGGSNVSMQRAAYVGLKTCSAAAAVSSGGKGCSWGCLGLADCVRACDYDAMFMDRFDIPHVIPANCTACGDCVEACPKDLFLLMDMEQKLIVQCKSALEGEEIEALCKVACTACGRCALDAADGLIEMKNGLAVVDYQRNDLAGQEALARCPTGAIVWIEGTQFADQGAPELVEAS